MSQIAGGVAILMTAIPAANAGPVTWQLENVTFTDGGTASGRFILDVDAGTTTWPAPGMTTIAGSIGTGVTYVTPPVSGTISGGYTRFYFNEYPPSQFNGSNDYYGYSLSLWTSAPLTDAGGVVPLGPGANNFGFEREDHYTPAQNQVYFRFIAGGSLVGTGSSAPEPGTLGTFGIAGLCFAAALSRRRAFQRRL